MDVNDDARRLKNCAAYMIGASKLCSHSQGPTVLYKQTSHSLPRDIADTTHSILNELIEVVTPMAIGAIGAGTGP